MEHLLTSYSISDILIFVVILALAIKSLITFYDWAVARLHQTLDKDVIEEADKEKLENRLTHGSEIMNELSDKQNKLSEEIKNLADKIEMLIESDRDDIASFITSQHHYYCYQKGWIDDASLEACEKRYAHYQQEGGNGRISHYMEDLRELPHQEVISEKLLDKD